MASHRLHRFVAVTSLLLAAAAAERRRQLIEVVEMKSACARSSPTSRI